MIISLRNSLAALLLMAASTGALAEQNKVVSPAGRLVVNVEDASIMTSATTASR